LLSPPEASGHSVRVNGPRPQVKSATDRLVVVFAAKPYIVAAVTVAFLLIVWDTGRTAFGADAGTHSWLDWVILAVIAYAAIVLFVLVPRVFLARAVSRGQEARVTLLRWSFATSPFLIAFALWALGASTWAATVALLASVVLVLVNATIAVRRAEPNSG
jgi:protein-S-isoprenylcysteine O-methyltransferase Ste14